MIVALIPAAGSGSRIGGTVPKQYQEVAGRPLLGYAVEAFASSPSVEAVYVVVAPDDERFELLELPATLRARVHRLPVGGATRHASVLNGLDALEGVLLEEDWVLVHDGARPGIEVTLIEHLIGRCGSDPVGGLLALPLADTLKQGGTGDGAAVHVVRTLPREGLWQAQTPQMFRYGLLRGALHSAREGGTAVTDEASAIEALGFAPRLVTGSQRNFKVTYPEDLALAGLILKQGAA